MIMKMFKKEEGITIVALIAVIIVLLIISGVAISQLTKTNKIIDTSKLSALAYKQDSFEEKVKLKITNLKIEKMGNATLQDVIGLKGTDPEITDVYKSGENAILIMDNYQCEIDENLNIKSVEEYKKPSKNQIQKVKRRITYCSFDRNDE